MQGPFWMNQLCQTSAQEAFRHKNQLPKSQFSLDVLAEALPGEAIVALDGIHPSKCCRASQGPLVLNSQLRLPILGYTLQ
jgi:hypothetical protein